MPDLIINTKQDRWIIPKDCRVLRLLLERRKIRANDCRSNYLFAVDQYRWAFEKHANQTHLLPQTNDQKYRLESLRSWPSFCLH